MVTHPCQPFARECTRRIRRELWSAPEDCLRFFDALFLHQPEAVNVNALADLLGTNRATLCSRFYRRRLPDVKRYLDAARLVLVAHQLQSPVTLRVVAAQLGYSSQQALSKHLRMRYRVTSIDLRRVSGEQMLQRFLDEFIVPFRATLVQFRPLAVLPRGNRYVKRFVVGQAWVA